MVEGKDVMTYPIDSPPESLPHSLEVRKDSVWKVDVILCCAHILLALTVSFFLAFGPDRLRKTKAMEIVSGLGVSWTAISILFLLAGLLLCHRTTRVAGWAVGFVLYAYYLTVLFISMVIQENGGSFFALAAAVAAMLSQASGLARSIVTEEWRKSGEARELRSSA